MSANRPNEESPEGDEWIVSPYDDGEQIFDEEDRVSTVHPVYVVPQQKVDDVQKYYKLKQGF